MWRNPLGTRQHGWYVVTMNLLMVGRFKIFMYSATAHSVARCFFLWLVDAEDLECEQYDMVTAYLHSKIPQGIRLLVRPPTGFSDGSSSLCLLRNALCGLVRSPL